jgi:hypothetical protein
MSTKLSAGRTRLPYEFIKANRGKLPIDVAGFGREGQVAQGALGAKRQRQ